MSEINIQALTEQITATAKNVNEIQESMKSMATDAKVEALAKELTRFQELKHRQEKALRPHPILGNQENVDQFAGKLAKALFSANMIEKGSEQERFWSQKANEADINSTDTGKGKTGLPTYIDPTVSKLVESNGIAPKYCNVRRGVQGTIGVNRRLTRTTVAGQTRPDSAAGTGGSTYEAKNLSTTQVSHITLLEEKLLWDSPVDFMGQAIEDLAEASAEFMDDVLFAGGGTATDLSFTGLNTTTGIDEIPVAKAAFTSPDSIINLRTKVHTSVIGHPSTRIFMHPYIFAKMQTLKASSSGVYFFDPQTASFRLGGDEIVFAPRMDSEVDTDKVIAIYGRMDGVTLGYGIEYRVQTLMERYADLNQIGVKVYYTAGLVVVEADKLARCVVTES